MASASITSALPRWATRQLLLAIVVVAAAMVGLALLAEAMSGGGGTVYLAQIEPGGSSVSVPSLVAVGYGEAAVPAERAELQLTFSDLDAYYNGGPAAAPTPGATPGAEELRAAQPIVAAIVAAGVPADSVRVVTSSVLIFELFGPSEADLFRIDVTVDQPDVETLTAIFDAAAQVGLENGLRLMQAGAAYLVADCSALRDRAWEVALADARRRVEAQAAQLGVTAGDLLSSREEPILSPGGTNTRSQVIACGLDNPPLALGTGSIVLSVPPFDPTAPAVVVVAVRLHLAVEIVQD